MVFFFFKQKTAYEMRISDWSSDVCSSDLGEGFDATGWTLHARRTHRHASQCKSPGIRFLDQQPFDVLDRHMTLHEIAADLRGVAGMLCGGHAQAGLYRLEFALVADIDAEAIGRAQV